MRPEASDRDERIGRCMIAGMRIRHECGDETATAFLTDLCAMHEHCNAEGRDPTPDEHERLRCPPSPPYFTTTDRRTLSN